MNVGSCGSEWVQTGLRVRKATLGAVGKADSATRESGMIGTCQTHGDRAHCGMRIGFRGSDRARPSCGSSALPPRIITLTRWRKSRLNVAARRATSGRCGKVKREGTAAYCRPKDRVALVVERLNNTVRVLLRRRSGLRDEEYLRLKIPTCMLLTL